jgi:hypothetical protein
MYVAWKIQKSNWSIASVRYRFWLPYVSLKDDFRFSIYTSGQDVVLDGKLNGIVYVKSLFSGDLDQARELKKQGVFIVYDLCDNIFYLPEYYKNIGEQSRLKQSLVESSILKEFLLLADCVTVPSETLKEELFGVVPTISRIEILPDPIMPDIKEPWGGLRTHQYLDYIFGHGKRWGVYKSLQLICFFLLLKIPRHLFSVSLRILQKTHDFVNAIIFPTMFNFFRVRAVAAAERNALLSNVSNLGEGAEIESPSVAVNEKRKLLWFGNGGRENLFGITDLVCLKKELEELNQEVPIVLTIISNDRGLFEKHILNMRIETRYIQWSEEIVIQELAKTDVVILPNSDNSFSRCKSANRALLSLYHEKPVVVSCNPSLADLEGAVLFENWRVNIKAYLTEANLRHSHLEQARRILSEKFSVEAYVASWRKVLLSTNQTRQEFKV